MFVATYNQADRSNFPTRRDFGRAIKEALNSVKCKEESHYWVCFLEHHGNSGDYFSFV